jgi:heptosyltransferase-1
MVDPRFLIVRLGSLGDIIHAFPAVSGLRDSFPGDEIVWVTHPKWEFLVKCAGVASDVWTIDTRDWTNVRSTLEHIRRYRFDTAIDYQGLWKSAAIPFLARIPRRIGFSSATVREFGVPLLYTDRVRASASAHIADQNGSLTTRTGAKTATGPVTLTVPDEDDQLVRARMATEGIEDYIVLSPGGGWESKCWPLERYALLATRISCEFGLQSVINVGPGEKELASSLIRAAGDAQPMPFTGSLSQLMALLKNARVVISGDTGPLHLADVLGTPVVALFGPTDPARNGPYWRSGIVLRWEHAVTTYKRRSGPDESMLHLSVDEVMNALRALRVAA